MSGETRRLVLGVLFVLSLLFAAVYMLVRILRDVEFVDRLWKHFE